MTLDYFWPDTNSLWNHEVYLRTRYVQMVMYVCGVRGLMRGGCTRLSLSLYRSVCQSICLHICGSDKSYVFGTILCCGKYMPTWICLCGCVSLFPRSDIAIWHFQIFSIPPTLINVWNDKLKVVTSWTLRSSMRSSPDSTTMNASSKQRWYVNVDYYLSTRAWMHTLSRFVERFDSSPASDFFAFLLCRLWRSICVIRLDHHQ